MKWPIFAVGLVATTLFLAGCQTFSGAPRIASAAITPAELKPGDTAVITVNVKDRHRLVDRVQGVVKEEPRITFNLHDDGLKGDKKAKDHEWSMQVDVPITAPPGEFLLEFTALRGDGTPVPVRDKKGHVTQLKTTLPLVIRYAPQ